jgi:hypothetical protein
MNQRQRKLEMGQNPKKGKINSRMRGRGLRKENDLKQWMKPERGKESGLLRVS